MSKPRILRLSRPYESVEEYVANEGWSISNKRMILIDQPKLEKDTIVRFEVSLANKEKVIRAEARVVGYQAPENGRPGGPKVRFKRFGGTTKAFIQRVVADHGPLPGLDTIYPSSPAEALASVHPAPADSTPDHEAPSDPEASSSPDAEEPLSGPHSADFRSPESQLNPSNGASLDAGATAEALERLRQLTQSQTEHRIEAPPDRDSLLERLRQRARGAANP